jgi:hypothetical protein
VGNVIAFVTTGAWALVIEGDGGVALSVGICSSCNELIFKKEKEKKNLL